MKIGSLLPLAVLLLSAAVAPAADWAQFGGPTGHGHSDETGLVRKWPEEGPPVLWRIPVGQGWNCPSVAGDDVVLAWTKTLRGDEETVACVSAATGREKWRYSYPVGPYWERNIGWARGGVRATAAIAGDRVVTLGPLGHLHCLDRREGKVLWEQKLWDEWIPAGEKGYSFSPRIVDDKVILFLGDSASPAKLKERVFDVTCLALSLADGSQQWCFREPHRPPARQGEGQTPAVIDFASERCVLYTANCELQALRVSDGKQLWKAACVKPEARSTTIPTPLVAGEYMVNSHDADIFPAQWDPKLGIHVT